MRSLFSPTIQRIYGSGYDPIQVFGSVPWKIENAVWRFCWLPFALVYLKNAAQMDMLIQVSYVWRLF
jgi:hypothetical protein